MSLWNHLPIVNLITLQRRAALAHIDEQIRRDWRDGYGRDVDVLLERRHVISEQMKRGLAA